MNAPCCFSNLSYIVVWFMRKLKEKKKREKNGNQTIKSQTKHGLL